MTSHDTLPLWSGHPSFKIATVHLIAKATHFKEIAVDSLTEAK